MSNNILKILPLNDAPSAIRQDLILNAFVGSQSDMLGFVTGRRVAEAAQEIVTERDRYKAQLDTANKRIARLERHQWKNPPKTEEAESTETPATTEADEETVTEPKPFDLFGAFHAELFKGITAREDVSQSSDGIDDKTLLDYEKFVAAIMKGEDKAAKVGSASRELIEQAKANSE